MSESKISRISRRKFLKLSAATLAALGLKDFRWLFKHEYQMPIEFKVSPLSNHLLYPGMIDSNTSLVLGETNMRDLAWWRWGDLKDVDKKVLNAGFVERAKDRFIDSQLEGNVLGVGGSRDEAERHNGTLILMRERGVELVATDLLFYFDSVENMERIDYESLLRTGINTHIIESVGASLTTFYGLDFLLRKFGKKMGIDKKNIDRIDYLMLGGLTVMASDLNLKSRLTGGVKLVNRIIGEIYESFLNIRDVNMAYNSRYVEAMLG